MQEAHDGRRAPAQVGIAGGHGPGAATTPSVAPGNWFNRFSLFGQRCIAAMSQFVTMSPDPKMAAKITLFLCDCSIGRCVRERLPSRRNFFRIEATLQTIQS
ncbi:hypothetical protein [Luteimonas abyssi]|uniref:hypothetical protein n=1 Tax=Luteimonas abyssi TaxID=1247514 RepID=UPI0012F80FA7|nr:hypothetical protein [Luteimonas abyssi]